MVVAAALAERAGDISLKIAEATHAGQNTMGEFIYEAVASAETRLLPAITADELVAAQGLTDVDLIKLDIEGCQLRALLGATKVLRKSEAAHPAGILPRRPWPSGRLD